MVVLFAGCVRSTSSGNKPVQRAPRSTARTRQVDGGVTRPPTRRDTIFCDSVLLCCDDTAARTYSSRSGERAFVYGIISRRRLPTRPRMDPLPPAGAVREQLNACSPGDFLIARWRMMSNVALVPCVSTRIYSPGSSAFQDQAGISSACRRLGQIIGNWATSVALPISIARYREPQAEFVATCCTRWAIPCHADRPDSVRYFRDRIAELADDNMLLRRGMTAYCIPCDWDLTRQLLKR